MNKIVKIFLILGFLCLGGGIIVFYEILGRRSFDVPGDSKAIEIWALSFWYIEPIIGIFLLFASGRKVTKFCGAFFLIASLCAWINYFYFN
jgi:hypothetical protein